MRSRRESPSSRASGGRATGGPTSQQPFTRPTLGARTSKVVDVDGLQFKDLNGNGRLDPYEDWRLPVPERVADLLSRMSVEEKVGTMLITSHYMGASEIIGDPEQGLLNIHEKWSETNFWADPSSSTYRFDPPVLDYAGSQKAIAELGLRYHPGQPDVP